MVRMKKILGVLGIVLVLLSGKAFASEKSFPDLDKSHWAYDLIMEMTENKIINGYPDGTFKAENGITRAEAAKILMLSLQESAVFSDGAWRTLDDVPVDHWAAKYIINGKLYITPYEDGTFRPEQKITRIEFVNALGKILNRVTPEEVKDVHFSDIEKLNEESKKNVKTLVNLGIINGYEDGTFRPNNTLTRAELCKIVANALQYRTSKYIAEISQTEGWQQYDRETGWHSEVNHDDDGNIKVYVGDGIPVQLYYNGEFVTEAAPTVRTVMFERVTTRDGKEWDIKWIGDKVVDFTYNFEENALIITNYATNYVNWVYCDNNYVIDVLALAVYTDFTGRTQIGFYEEENFLCFFEEDGFC